MDKLARRFFVVFALLAIISLVCLFFLEDTPPKYVIMQRCTDGIIEETVILSGCIVLGRRPNPAASN
jgi:hypothetical protein